MTTWSPRAWSNVFKLKFDGSSFLVASSWQISRGCRYNMSQGNRVCRTCRTRMRRGWLRLVRNKSCVSCSWNLENDKWTNGKHYTAVTNQISKLNGEVPRHVRHPRSILARMSGVSTKMSRECYTRKLLPWNLIFTESPR